MQKLTRTKSVETILAETSDGSDGLKRSMGVVNLTMFSVGSIVGTGIFVILSVAVPEAGPAVLISFILAGITCAFSALSYAEMASTLPISGSSYSYTYATMGEGVAWVCGWCLMLEYGVSVAAVSVGWGQYINEIFSLFGVTLPPELALPPGQGGIVNIPAVVVVLMATFLLLRGASESATVNTILVFVKIGILFFFCAIAFVAFDAGNLMPFIPLGLGGITLAASQVFFSFIGFDTAATASEEAKNPKRDLPRAIIASLIIVTVLYVMVALAAIAAKPWESFEGSGGDAVLAQILQEVTGDAWPAAVLSIGAIISIFSVVLAVMYGQTRILFAMGRDGLLPSIFTKVNKKTQTPVPNTLIVASIISVLAAFVPLATLAEATSIGTLFAFMLVNISVIILRRTKPDLPRGFKTPLFPITPILGVLFCAGLLLTLRETTWITFAVWMTFGIIVYFTYGIKHSTLGRTGDAGR
jgi:APA family basic amino acid/polyamine antiporter